MNEKPVLHVPSKFRRGGKRANQWKSIDSGRWLLEYMAQQFGYDDFGKLALLDMGCGVKFTQAILEYSIPIKHYVGIDVYREMIDFLLENVDDERFEYQHADIHNAMYNTGGIPLESYPGLPVGDQEFDVICLYSVFTHLAPHDYPLMLKLLRRYIKPDGKLIYTLFINEHTETGHGLIDALTRDLGPGPASGYEPPPFEDLDKDKPLRWAVYSRTHALELVADTGWKIECLNQPTESGQIAHHFICTPD